jgi:hypothetical protein
MTHPPRIPDPVPVSGPPDQSLPPGAVGNTGPIYGTQRRRVWSAGDTAEVQVCDAIKPPYLWQFTAFGAVLISITYGTLGTRHLLKLRAPVVLTIPGQFTATAQPLDDQGAECRVTLTPVNAPGHACARRLATGPEVLSPDAVRFVALDACALTIAGVAVALTASQSVPLVAGSSLTTGNGLQEFEI